MLAASQGFAIKNCSISEAFSLDAKPEVVACKWRVYVCVRMTQYECVHAGLCTVHTDTGH